MEVESEVWNRNHWYRGMTDKQIREHKEHEAMRREWEQTPEGQQYLNEQDDLMREILESE